ncbi:MAG: CBS domain-containing protein [Deltaproteobacteria bacterium]|jgi:CBS domain-containing protein|nr:MAG: CBS domain-containing protein [Deltaproteobacteria bacterium]TNF26011.1 MAG: CBS domain-containing protein [Deltaproteobacteria bacterium]
MNISEFMSSPAFSVGPDTTVEAAAKIMCDNKVSALPVVDSDSKVVGIITESDFVGRDAKVPHALGTIKELFGQIHNFNDIEAVYKSAKDKKISDVMTKAVKTVDKNSDLNDLLKMMSDTGLKRVPVTENGKLVGMVTRKDLIKAFLKS